MPYPKFPPVTLEQWQAAAEKTLRGKPLESLTWHTPDGLAVKPLYTACLLYTSPSPRDKRQSRMPSSA